MKKAVFSAAALALAAGSAFAADLPSKKTALYIPPPPPPMWTGFYVGLNAGGTFSDNSSTTIVTGPLWTNPIVPGGFPALFPFLSGPVALSESGRLGSANNGGFIGGGQVGYNYQFGSGLGGFGSAWVIGVEADIQGVAGSNGNQTGVGAGAVGVLGSAIDGTPIMTTFNGTRSLDYLGTVRGRVGFLITPALLLYGTGGLAYGGVNSSVSYLTLNPALAGVFLAPAWGASGSYSDTRVGWTAGGGLEWLFTPNWSAKVEYLYYDLGSVSYAVAPSGPVVLTGAIGAGQLWWSNASSASTRFNGHVVRVGLNYHFNWLAPAPVLAKY